MVPQLADLRVEILKEFHRSRFVVHPGHTKMYPEATRWGFFSMVSHVSTSKSRALEASRTTPALGGNRVEVGACHDGFCDPLATDIVEP